MFKAFSKEIKQSLLIMEQLVKFQTFSTPLTKSGKIKKISTGENTMK